MYASPFLSFDQSSVSLFVTLVDRNDKRVSMSGLNLVVKYNNLAVTV